MKITKWLPLLVVGLVVSAARAGMNPDEVRWDFTNISTQTVVGTGQSSLQPRLTNHSALETFNYTVSEEGLGSPFIISAPPSGTIGPSSTQTITSTFDRNSQGVTHTVSLRLINNDNAADPDNLVTVAFDHFNPGVPTVNEPIVILDGDGVFELSNPPAPPGEQRAVFVILNDGGAETDAVGAVLAPGESQTFSATVDDALQLAGTTAGSLTLFNRNRFPNGSNGPFNAPARFDTEETWSVMTSVSGAVQVGENLFNGGLTVRNNDIAVRLAGLDSSSAGVVDVEIVEGRPTLGVIWKEIVTHDYDIGIADLQGSPEDVIVVEWSTDGIHLPPAVEARDTHICERDANGNLQPAVLTNDAATAQRVTGGVDLDSEAGSYGSVDGGSTFRNFLIMTAPPPPIGGNSPDGMESHGVEPHGNGTNFGTRHFAVCIPDAGLRFKLRSDFNGDFKVDQEDLNIFTAFFGKSVPRLTAGDATSDGRVGGPDFISIQRAFGTDATGLMQVNVVPELTTGLLALTWLVGWIAATGRSATRKRT